MTYRFKSYIPDPFCNCESLGGGCGEYAPRKPKDGAYKK